MEYGVQRNIITSLNRVKLVINLGHHSNDYVGNFTGVGAAAVIYFAGPELGLGEMLTQGAGGAWEFLHTTSGLGQALVAPVVIFAHGVSDIAASCS